MDFVKEPIGKGFDVFACLGADGNHLRFGIAHVDILLAFLEIEIKVRHDIYLVDNHRIANAEHQGIFEGFVVPFGHREDHGVLDSACIKLSRTNEIADILQDNEVVLIFQAIDSRVFSSTTIRKHQFFSVQPSL